jgi:hypothetical protein
MKSILTKLFTAADNTTWDLGRVLWAKISVTYVGLSVWYYGTGHAFDPIAWATGAAGILAGGAANLKIKLPTEPSNAGAFDKPAG